MSPDPITYMTIVSARAWANFWHGEYERGKRDALACKAYDKARESDGYSQGYMEHEKGVYDPIV